MTTPATPTREIIVRSFQPGRRRAAAHKGRHAGRAEHAGFLHFGDNAVAPNEVIGKSDLINQVWPGISVEEGSLRFHIANLRKVLGDGKNGTRYITTASGRGYRFVAPILRSEQRSRE
jgi:DNA-binding response OmpR family regulator